MLSRDVVQKKIYDITVIKGMLNGTYISLLEKLDYKVK
jgi:hypothetical protein